MNLYFVRFTLSKDLEGVIRQVAKFCGFSVPDRVIQKTMIKSTFDHMSKDASTNYSWDNHCRRQGSEPFIRKGKVGDWKNYFSAAQNSIFDTLYDGLLQDSGLEFEFWNDNCREQQAYISGTNLKNDCFAYVYASGFYSDFLASVDVAFKLFFVKSFVSLSVHSSTLPSLSFSLSLISLSLSSRSLSLNHSLSSLKIVPFFSLSLSSRTATLSPFSHYLALTLTTIHFSTFPRAANVNLRCPETLFISHEHANFLFSVFRVVRGEAKTPKIMGCCRAIFAFLHALKIGTFRGKWTLEWVLKTSQFFPLALYFSINSKLAFSLHVSERCLTGTAKKID